MHKYANPKKFLSLLAVVQPLAGVLAILALGAGLYMSANAPEDYQQGMTAKIMYIHVPAAWMGLFVYVTMAIAAFCGLVWKHVVAELYAKAAAPLGAAFTLVCLVTGSLWGKPMWGTWWVWDARLTSVLVLFFLYLGYIALVDAFDDEQKGLNAGAALLLAGLVNIPVIKFSVEWWNTLHQGASVMRLDGPAIEASMLWPLLVMALAFKAFFVFFAALRIKTELALRKMRMNKMKEVL